MSPRLNVLGLSLALCGCADFAPRADTDSGDFSPPDASVPSIDAGMSNDDFDGLLADADDPPEPGPGAGGFERGAACYDGIDNDASGSLDCEDIACATLGACCVGDASCVGTEQTILSVDFATCTDAASCRGTLRLFGEPTPYLDGDGIAFGGDVDYDSGFEHSTSVDLRSEQLTLQGVFAYGDCVGCLESAAIGVTTRTELDENQHVAPLVALRINQGVGGAELLIGDRVVATFELGDATLPWRLMLSPDGTVAVSHGGVGMPTNARFVPVPGAHIVGWGHSSNPGPTGSPSGVRLNTFDVETASAEIPNAWRLRTPLAGAPISGDVRVSAARHLETTYVAIASSTFSVHEYADERLTAVDWTIDAEVQLGGATEFVLASDGRELYVHTFDATGALRRLRLVGDVFTDDETMLERGDLSWDDARSPTILYHLDHTIVVAEVDGALAGAIRGPETLDEWRPLQGLTPHTEGARHPTLVVAGGTYQMHFVQSRGTRDHLELLASNELLGWRHVPGEAMSGQDDRNAFDRFGANRPAAVAHEGELLLFYAGDNLVRSRLGVAVRGTRP